MVLPSFDWYRLLNVLKDIEDLDGDALCRRFEKLSIDSNSAVDDGAESSSVPSLNRALRIFNPWWDGIIQGMKSGVSFENFIPSSHNNIEKMSMAFAFRFLPGQTKFLLKELMYSTEKFEKLTIFSNELGLSYITSKISPDTLFPSSSIGAGFRGLVNEPLNVERVLTDVVTCAPGYLGRYLTLIITGVGCVVWYKVDPISLGSTPDSSIFGPLYNYELFFDQGYRPPGFQVIKFLETGSVAQPLNRAIKEEPLCELTIPGGGPLLRAVGLGIMLSFVLAAGVVPSENGWCYA